MYHALWLYIVFHKKMLFRLGLVRLVLRLVVQVLPPELGFRRHVCKFGFESCNCGGVKSNFGGVKSNCGGVKSNCGGVKSNFGGGVFDSFSHRHWLCWLW